MKKVVHCAHTHTYELHRVSSRIESDFFLNQVNLEEGEKKNPYFEVLIAYSSIHLKSRSIIISSFMIAWYLLQL